ncbi:MAG: hypothetical protein N2508_09570 [Anaerolineae bacterium]|nr:hypothetical protein [Anaerolineae bacterium]
MDKLHRLKLLLTALLVVPPCLTLVSVWLFHCTGEERLLSQVRGIGHLVFDLFRPRPETASYAAIDHAGVNPFGINVFLNQEVELWKRERTVQMVAEAGFHWLRQEFPWEDIEIHGKGDFTDRRNDLDGDGTVDPVNAWAKYDHIVELAEQYGLELVPRLSNPPAWSRALTDTIGTYAPPDNLADWGDYVYAVVSRYRGRVRYYQLWNEPNIYPEWGEQPVDPEGYTRLLCEGYRRARQADPDVVILSGALAPTIALTWRDLNDFVFLQRMYDAGAAACFDILSVNDYMLWSGPTDRRMRPLNVNFSRPIYLRDIMVANGDAAKPIWISEMNSNAVPDDPTGIQRWGDYGKVTLEQQARYAVLAYQRVIEEWPWVGVVSFWFFKRASDAERNQAMYYFRMVEPDFTPLPVYEAMREYITGLTPTLYPGYHQEEHWAIRYEGEWATVGKGVGAYRLAKSPGAMVRFTVEGASLVLVPGPGTGEVEVYLDSEAPRRISLNGSPVPLVRGWSERRHEVTLKVVAGDVAIDGVIVKPAPFWWKVALVCLACSIPVLLYGYLLRRGR